ncbi:MAG: thioredoxin [Lachnospiraceae bacterium]|nr:thioredoxin [Lachnospiraceae bacterium]
MAEHLTAENFKEKVEDTKGTVLVDFFATWCGPCKMVAPAVEQLSEEYAGKAAVYKLDVDEAQDVAMKYRVMSIPTLVFFKDGQETERIRGAVSRGELAEAMERNL